MKFAIEIEKDSLEFYKTCREVIKEKELDAIFAAIIDAIENRLKILERVRRENVTEMILEPIKDLESDLFQIEPFLLQDFNDDLILETVLRNEKKRQEFFEAATEKIEFLIEAADAFERLAEQNQKNMEILSDYKATL